jgi:hypothetical protein
MRTTGFHLGVRTLGWTRWMRAATLATVLAAGTLVPTRGMHDPHSTEAVTFNNIYYYALLSGRDADAAVRRARYLTGSLMQHLGMTRSAAIAEVVRTMITRSGVLCSGG